MKVFVSSQAVSRSPAAELIDALRGAGAMVEHSPVNPIDGRDPRWTTWYADLADLIGECDVFVAVIDAGWDSSTWMGVEADVARARVQRCTFWNPHGVRVTAPGLQPYLTHALPGPLAEAVAAVMSDASKRH